MKPSSGRGHLWCSECALKALTLLPDTSGFDCDTWADEGAADYLDAVKTKMGFVMNVDDDKRDERREKPSTETSKGETKKGLPLKVMCALCEGECKEGDRFGKSKGVDYTPDTKQFHKACRAELLAWWKPRANTFRAKGSLSTVEQWSAILCRAEAIRSGAKKRESLKEPVPEKPDGDMREELEELKDAAKLTGNSEAGGLLAAMSKCLLKGQGESTACDEDKREFGLNRLLWDKKDLAVEAPKRKKGRKHQQKKVTDAEMERDDFLYDLIDKCNVDQTGSQNKREWLDDDKSAANFNSRKKRETYMYAILEGVARLVLAMDAEKLKEIDGGEELVEVCKDVKSTARYAQERIYWVADDTFSWDAIEGGEKIRLDSDMLLKHKGGKRLSRDKLLEMVRKKRREFMQEYMKKHGRNKNGKGKEVADLHRTITKLKKGLADKGLKSKRGNKTGVFDLQCNWCKRAERTHIMHTHDTKDCRIRKSGGDKRKRS